MTTSQSAVRALAEAEIETSGFFVLRTPLLPIDELEAWNQAAEQSASPPEEARAELRAGLGRLLERPEIREALFVASPVLEVGLDAWRRDPDGKKGCRAERALVRYLYRMAARPTPFGLFSGCSVGLVGSRTRLRLGGRPTYRRHSRLDTGYLFALNAALTSSRELHRRLRFWPNSSLYRAAGRMRYVEARLQGALCTHLLVAVEISVYLESVLRRAARGAIVAELAESLVEADPDGEITLEEAEEFGAELIDSQILVSSLSPPVTGREALGDLLGQLREHPVAEPVIERLEGARNALANLDAAGAGHGPEAYRRLARHLEPLPAEVDPKRMVQVDMIKPAPGATVGAEVVAEIERGIDVLRRLVPPRQDPLELFRQRFSERYGERSLPLVEVLDEEIGIGFAASEGPGGAASPLLAGFLFPSREGPGQISWGPRETLLLNKLTSAFAEDLQEIELTAKELKALSGPRLPALPDAFQALATVAADSPEALDRGEFRIYLKNVAGPSGVRLLGRFCHADASLRRHVERHLRQEEELDPEAIFAEIVHLPAGRLGNVLSRPVLRRHEIPFLGRGGSPAELQISVTDLLVSVRGDQVVLHCKRSGRRVIPRLTNAHLFTGRAVGAYRFLCTLQAQGVRSALYWSWGALDGCSFLPRVKSGRVVLARARWQVPREEIQKLVRTAPAERLDAVERWRAGRRIPRWALLLEGDQELPVDFHNLLSVDTFLASIERRHQVLLDELFPAPDQLCARGPEGRFAHEIIVPFVSRRKVSSEPAPPPPAGTVRRIFPTGSEWLYANLYTGTSTADEVLLAAVAPVVRRALAGGAADRWFFIRYGDPDWHLRLRLHGHPRRLHDEVLPLLQRSVAPLLDDGRIWRLQLDTYEREVERYGGAEGIAIAEQLFWADSEAVLEILASLDGDEGAADRWRLTLRGIDLLLTDLGFGIEEKLDLLKSMQESFARELGIGRAFRKQLARRLRRERRGIDEALEPVYLASHPLAAGFRALDRRSQRLAPIAAELRSREQTGRLGHSRRQLAGSFVHMFTNRLLRSDGRAHELVLYDFLYRVTLSRAARARSQAM